MGLYEDMKSVFQRYLETERQVSASKADMLNKQASSHPQAHAAAVLYHAALGTHQAVSLLVDSMQNKARGDRNIRITMLKVKRELHMTIPANIRTLTDVVHPSL